MDEAFAAALALAIETMDEVRELQEQRIAAVKVIATLEQQHTQNLHAISELLSHIEVLRVNPDAEMPEYVRAWISDMLDRQALIEEHDVSD